MDVDEQREQLARLRGLEHELGSLRERARDLEVSRITAESTLTSAPEKLAPVSAQAGERARAIVDALARRAQLVQALGRGQGARAEPPEQLRAGAARLREWLEAPGRREPQSVGRRIVDVVFLALVGGAIWATIEIHIAFLILLIPVGGVHTFMTRTGDDTKWRRLGARRHFERSGLRQPAAWNEDAVAALLASLEERIGQATHGADPGATPGENERAALDDALEDAQVELAALLDGTGIALEGPDPAVAQHLHLLHDLQEARDELAETAREVERVRAEANDLADVLYAFLSRAGAAPPSGRTDSATLESALNELVLSNGTVDVPHGGNGDARKERG